jgi:hypothetical protein
MTRAEEIRARVIELDADGYSTLAIAAELQIPMARVDRILDDQDAAQGVPHPERVRAPVLEPLGGPAVINSAAAVGGGRDKDKSAPKRRPVGTKPKPPPKPRDRTGPTDRTVPTPRHLIRCGTLPGYNLHRREGTPTCQPCRDVYNAYNIQKYGRKREPIVCGTYRGWKKHHRQNEKPCDECKAAYREKSREWRKTTPQTPEDQSRRTELHQQGMTDRQIAAEVGVARIVIAKWRAYHGLPVNREAS